MATTTSSSQECLLHPSVFLRRNLLSSPACRTPRSLRHARRSSLMCFLLRIQLQLGIVVAQSSYLHCMFCILFAYCMFRNFLGLKCLIKEENSLLRILSTRILFLGLEFGVNVLPSFSSNTEQAGCTLRQVTAIATNKTKSRLGITTTLCH